MEVQFDKKPINNDLMRNRESKLVLLIDGIVGFNELALLRKMIKERTDKSVSILVESFCNTQQYADYLMRPFDKHHRNKNNWTTRCLDELIVWKSIFYKRFFEI
jgi:hypothetical protein